MKLRKKLILHSNQAPGDTLMLTAAVRSLHLAHSDQYLIDVRTPHPDLWKFNTGLTAIDDDDPEARHIDCHYPLIHQSNQGAYHFIHGFRKYLEEQLGVAIPSGEFKGHIRLSHRERLAPSVIEEITGEDIPYWIINAGGKHDFTAKWWHAERFQEVVDYFRGRILFVQVGTENDYHPELSGVISLVGQTTLRELILLTHHAEGVITGVSLPMHLAAAVPVRKDKPPSRACVVPAGGREPSHWEAYSVHQFVHTNGALSCCDTGGCWKSRTLPLGDGDDKDRPDNLCVDLVNKHPRCLDMISAKTIIDRTELYFTGKRFKYLENRQWEKVASFLTQAKAKRRSVVLPENPAVSICVVAYGDYPTLIQRCVESIHTLCDRSQYRLYVGANAVGEETRSYLESSLAEHVIDEVIWREDNINKCPMMRKLFELVDTRYIWWFDDDTYVHAKDALGRRIEMADAADEDVVMWGHEFFMSRLEEFSQGVDIALFVKNAPWYGGLPLPVPPVSWKFITGGNWFIRTSAIRRIDWPHPKLIKAADDVLMGEALRQQGLKCENIEDYGVYISAYERRGGGEDRSALVNLIS